MKHRILVAEDDPSLLKMMRRRLEHAGYEVVVATTGEEVFERIEPPGVIDLILLDLHQTGLDGFELCQRLKANPASATIPTILITAAETYLARLPGLCRELGANDYLGKPFRSLELLKKIQNVLRAQEPGPQANTVQLGPSQVTATPGGPVRVLVVDDDPKTREYFSEVLLAPDFQVVEVGSGQEAVGALKEAPFALAFVDIVMPGLDGLGTLKALHAEQPQLPVVMMTGYEVEDLIALALKFGAVDCLRKPLEDASSILNAVQQARPNDSTSV